MWLYKGIAIFCIRTGSGSINRLLVCCAGSVTHTGRKYIVPKVIQSKLELEPSYQAISWFKKKYYLNGISLLATSYIKFLFVFRDFQFLAMQKYYCSLKKSFFIMIICRSYKYEESENCIFDQFPIVYFCVLVWYM